MKRWMGCLILAICGLHTQAQTDPFQLALSGLSIDDMPALQSFVWGQADGKWLLLGGRTDGLHRRQPFASFDSLGQHRAIVVVDPTTKKTWSAPITALPTTLQDQLSATNLQFHQDGRYLYLTGGYGYCPAEGDHKTFPYLTAVDVPATIAAILHDRPFTQYFRQVTDSVFAVTGGQLERIDNEYYLVGGHNFQGRYNPTGPDHGPGFEQHYNHRILKFSLEDDGNDLTVTHFPMPEDTIALHRRDYNMLPQISPQGEQALMVFSGVFQYGANIPWYSCLTVNPFGHQPVRGFMQHYNHYHCPKIPLYSAKENAMHNLFFGGIAAYYDTLGTVAFNRDVPFVKTIARITRDADGNYAEYKLPIKMPAYLGASAEFIPNPTLPHYPNGVLNLDEFPSDSVLVGHIVGGIESNDDNVFWVNEGEHSKASTKVWAVYLRKNPTTAKDILNPHSTAPLQLQALPNYTNGTLSLYFYSEPDSPVKIQLHKDAKHKVLSLTLRDLTQGHTFVQAPCKPLKKGGTFLLTITSNGQQTKQWLIVEP